MREPHWLITYEGADVSDDLTEMVTGVTYTDNLHGKTDEIELTIEDRDGRWRTGWWPTKGDRVDLKLGYEGEPLLPCGRFKVDQVDLSGPPDVVTVRALAAAATAQLRTASSKAYGGTLREVIDVVAREFGLEVVGDIDDIPIARITQANETTVAFLKRLAEQYGYAFTIRDSKLVFFELGQLEKSPAVRLLDRTELTSYRFSSKTLGTYAACEVSFLDPATKKTLKAVAYAPHAREKVVVELDAGGGNVTGPRPALPSKTLRRGLKGPDVQLWQSFLRERGLYDGQIDGDYGPKTEAATRAFQRAQGLGADGVAGNATYQAALAAGHLSSGDAPADVASGRIETSGDVLKKQIRVETIEQAQLQAQALLDAANRLRVDGQISLPGDPLLVAGSNIQLTSMDRLSGKYSITKSTHRMSRDGGYTTELELKVADLSGVATGRKPLQPVKKPK
jgi:phage protein D